MGDPAGVGPELCVRVATDAAVRSAAEIVIVGTESVLHESAERLGHPIPKSVEIRSVAETTIEIPLGAVSREAGRLSAAYLDAAIGLAQTHEVDGIVTAPISKEAWHLAGVPFPGHTEYLAAKTQTSEYGMMLVHGDWRVVHLSTHCSLRRAIEMVSRERIVRMLRLFDSTLRDLGIERPHIGVAGLNPHAGEGGLFGDEEQTQIAPAVAEALALKIDATGPIAPDTIFARARAGEFDGVLAMYHDQGHVAVKTVIFEPSEQGGGWAAVHGVNVTIGLPIIRTSVDHGVAFDIAGRGTARADSMLDAIYLAATMATKKAQTENGG
jgi:4-hydroxythreonine-4-phosphate dehydrogenase